MNRFIAICLCVLLIALAAPPSAQAWFSGYDTGTGPLEIAYDGDGAGAFALNARQRRLNVPDLTLLYSEADNPLYIAGAADAIGEGDARALFDALSKGKASKVGKKHSPRTNGAWMSTVVRLTDDSLFDISFYPASKADGTYVDIRQARPEGKNFLLSCYVQSEALRGVLDAQCAWPLYRRADIVDVQSVRVYSLRTASGDSSEPTLLGTVDDRKAVKQLVTAVKRGKFTPSCKCSYTAVLTFVLKDGRTLDAHVKYPGHGKHMTICAGNIEVEVARRSVKPFDKLLAGASK